MSLLEYSEELARWNPKMRHKRHKCNFCKFLTTSFFCAVSHAKRHKIGLEPYHCLSNSVENYFCRNCNYTTDVTTEFKHHISEFHGNTQSEVGFDKVSQNYLCEKCGFETYSILNWLKHVSNYHSKDMVERDQSDKLVYPHSDQDKDETQCGYETQERRDLNEHGLGHIRLYKCSKCCYKTYKNITSSQIEQKKFVTWYKCKKCRDKTKQKLSLKQHAIMSYLEYREVYWYECDKCSFRAKHNESLKYHYNETHAEKCNNPKYQRHFENQCDILRSYLLSNNIGNPDLHSQHNTDETAQESRDLKQQEQKHIERYKCDKCSFRTKHNASLKFHRNTTHATKCDKPKHRGDLEKRGDILRAYLVSNNIGNPDFDSQQIKDETQTT